MEPPKPLPSPGAWIATADGSVYEVVEADPDGVTYLSVDSGEHIWTPWSDVASVGTIEGIDALTKPATAWTCPLQEVTHWPDAPPPVVPRIGDEVACGWCGLVTRWNGQEWIASD